MKSAVDLVVFDMAGTTVDDRMANGQEAVNGCLQAALRAAGLECTREQINVVMGLPKPDAITHLIKAGGRECDLLPKVTAIHGDFVQRMLHFYRDDPAVQPVAGAAETFAKLRKAGIKVALDTGFSRDIANVVLERLGWRESETVDATITSDEVSRGRPHPDMIQALMRRLNLNDASRVAKIGDTPSDLDEGTRAGCGYVIGVTSGSHTAEQLKPYPHTHFIRSVADLPELLSV